MGALTSCWQPDIAPSPFLPLPLPAGDAGRGLRDWGPDRHLSTLTLHYQALTLTLGSSETPFPQGTDESLLDSWYPSPHQGSATLGQSKPASLSSPLLLQACSSGCLGWLWSPCLKISLPWNWPLGQAHFSREGRRYQKIPQVFSYGPHDSHVRMLVLHHIA